MVIPTYYTVDGSFQLPQLANGSHQLSIGLEEGGPSNRTTWINTIYFTIGSSQPTPTLNPTLTPTISPTVTPTVPEFPALAILLLFNSVFIIAVKLRHRKTKVGRINLKEMPNT
jgi:hypothetical protein